MRARGSTMGRAPACSRARVRGAQASGASGAPIGVRMRTITLAPGERLQPRMLAREGEHLWVGGRTKAAEEDADEQQNEVVPVPGKQHAGQHSQQAADDNQLLAVALTVRTSGEELTDQNAYDGAAGKKETHHRRADVYFIGQKQAQGRRLQRPGNARQKGDDQEGGRGDIESASGKGGASVFHVFGFL